MSEQALIEKVEKELIENDNPTIFRCSEQLDKLFAAMSKAQGSMTAAKKDATNPFFKSSYADLHSVIDASRKALLDQGLCVIQTTAIGRSSVYLLTTLGHASGQWIQSKTPVLYEKGNNHSFGSGLTYARRYAWSAICGLASADDIFDDDGNASIPQRPQINPDPIDYEIVEQSIVRIKEIIDSDELNQETSDAINKIWSALSNDERLAVHDRLGQKAQGSNRMYKTMLKDYQNFHPAEHQL